ncbi:MAG TPA: HlyD family secretion protein [Planctomycetota bacterium]|jgi:membrane fusion protein (multidrug efflux system)
MNGAETAPSERSSAPPLKNGGRRRIVSIIFILVLIAAAVVGWRYYEYSRNYESTDDAFIDGHVVPVSARIAGHVARVLIDDNQHLEAGQLLLEIDPRDYQAIVDQKKAALANLEAKQKSAESTAAQIEITATAGLTQAQAGVEIAKANVEAAQAAVSSCRQRLEQAQAGVTVAQATIAQANAQVGASDATVIKNEQDVERYRIAMASNAATRQQFEYAVAAANVSKAELEANRKAVAAAEAKLTEAQAAQHGAQADVQQYEAQVGQTKASLGESLARLEAAKSAPQQIAVARSAAQAAAADVTQAKATLVQAELNLSYTVIKASDPGHVTRKMVEPGQYVQPGQTLLAVVPSNVWITANYKETQLTNMKPGDAVDVTVDAYPGKKFKAHVDSIQRGTGARFSLLPPENATGNYVKVVQRVPVKIVFDAPAARDFLLAPGMSVVPEVNVKAHDASATTRSKIEIRNSKETAN